MSLTYEPASEPLHIWRRRTVRVLRRSVAYTVSQYFSSDFCWSAIFDDAEVCRVGERVRV